MSTGGGGGGGGGGLSGADLARISALGSPQSKGQDKAGSDNAMMEFLTDALGGAIGAPGKALGLPGSNIINSVGSVSVTANVAPPEGATAITGGVGLESASLLNSISGNPNGFFSKLLKALNSGGFKLEDWTGGLTATSRDELLGRAGGADVSEGMLGMLSPPTIGDASAMRGVSADSPMMM